MSGNRQAAEWKVILTKYGPFYCEGGFEEELRSRKGLPPKGTPIDERDESKLQAADTAFFDLARELLVASKPRRTALVLDEAKWKWALRHLIEGEDESTATLEEISMEEAYEWVEGPPPTEVPPELYFHANFGIPAVAYFPNERGLWEFDPRDGWFFLGVTGTTAENHKYVFANDLEVIEISKVEKEDVVAEYSPLITSISRLLKDGLYLPKRLLQSYSLDTLASELEHATPSTGSDDQANQTAAAVAPELLANGLGIVEMVLPDSIEADRETDASCGESNLGKAEQEEEKVTRKPESESSSPELDAEDDGSGASEPDREHDLNRIPPHRRTIPLTKKKALPLLGFRGKSTRPLTKAMANGLYRFMQISRQSFIFDLDDIAEEKQWKAKPEVAAKSETKGTDTNSCTP